MTLLLVSACVPPNDGSGGGGEASFLPFLMLLTFFIFIYFVTIRPQQKRQKEHQTLVESLEKGDEVMTSSDEEKEPGNNENCYEIERAKACIPEYPMNR